MSHKTPKKNSRNRYYTQFTPWGEKDSYQDGLNEPIWKSYTPPNKRDELYSKRERYIDKLRELDDEIEEEENYQNELDERHYREFSNLNNRRTRRPRRPPPPPPLLQQSERSPRSPKTFQFDFSKPSQTYSDISNRRSTPIKQTGKQFEDKSKVKKNTIAPGLFQFNFDDSWITSKKETNQTTELAEKTVSSELNPSSETNKTPETSETNKPSETTDSTKEFTSTEKDDFFGSSSGGFIFQSGEKLKKPDPGTGLLQLLIQGSQIGESRPKQDKESQEKFKEKLKKRSLCLQGKAILDPVETLDDLITLADKVGDVYSLEDTYVLDMAALQKMAPSLRKLKHMIGLGDIKKQIVQQVLFYLQGLDEGNKDMLHTVIEGNPGVGKTEIAKILGEIYGAIGILSKGSFYSVKRADLVGGYLGQTATKTLEVLEKAKGGVLFIDEAYSLGNTEGKDMYSKECIDTITAYLSENREDFVCIIAGYKEALQKCFFKYNEGLERRFPWRYSIKSYNDIELKQIFEKIVQDHHWKCLVNLEFFTEHSSKFKNSGGDLENLFQKSKLAHAERCISIPFAEKKIITMKDVESGLSNFIQEKEEKNTAYAFMYN